MGTNDERKSCIKCQKVVKSTEKVLVCGLWCKKSFHSDCVGLTHSETRVVTCSNKRIKFHCETCENRLGIEKETCEPNKLQNWVNNSLLELLQKILKLTNELSNNNSVMNKKLDTVISSNARLEEYILQSPKCLEKRCEKTTDDSVEYVESFSSRRTMEISNENDTNSDNPNLNSVSMSQQTGDNNSSLHIASDVPEQLPDNQVSLVAEEGSSNECIPLEDFLVHSEFSIAKIECEEGKEKAEIRIDNKERIPLQDLVPHIDLSIAKTECEGDEEKTEMEVDKERIPLEDVVAHSELSIAKTECERGEQKAEIDKEELQHEIESAASDNGPKRSFVIGMDDHRLKDDSNNLVTKDSRTAGKGHRIRCTTKQGLSCGNDKTLKQKTTVKQDMQLHSGNSPYSCSVCNEKFTRKTSLKQHLRLHLRERPFSCSVCNKTFTVKTKLQRHSRSHSGERPYTCRICNKAFAQNTTLQQHLRIHSGERPFSCSVCKKTFSNSGALHHHSWLHSGERPHSCVICNKTFRHKRSLKNHSLLHSGERPFGCSVCNKTFTQKANLQRHLRLHSEELPLNCSVGNKTLIKGK